MILEDIFLFNHRLNDYEYIIPNNGNIITQIKEHDFYKYKYLTPLEFEKYHGGVCWDYVTYQAYYFKKYFPSIEYKIFFKCFINDEDNPTHSFMIFKYHNRYYWFESSWKNEKGIKSYKSEKSAINDIMNRMKMFDRRSFKKEFLIEYNPLDPVLFGMNHNQIMNYMHNIAKMNRLKLTESVLNTHQLIQERSDNIKLYFLTKVDMKDSAILQPRVPQNFLIDNGYEDGKTKRVCFSTSINGALMALSQNLENTELYVYEPVDVSLSDIYKPSITEVPDKSITGEIWIKKPVNIKFIGKIRVKDAKKTPHKYRYGDKTAELYDWNWKWIDKNINESQNNIDYEPPMSLNDIKNKYGHDLYNKLKKDPIHRWRAETGIELIHKEPTLKELNRIMYNWNKMDEKQKFISDKKSMELFGCTNINNYNKLIKSYTTESTINSNLLNEKSLDNFSKVYGAYDLKDRWNAAIDIDGKTYRYRVEVLVIQGNSVFLSTDKHGGIIIPGGSGEKDVPDIVQVMNECREEARINIKNVKYTGITRIQGLPPHIGKSKLTLPFTYEGSFSKIYVAEYDSPFTGFVDKRDEDKNMIKGKFYPIKSVINKLKPEWRAALSQYAVSGIMEACKDLKSAREFVVEVGKLAKKYDANYFIVTDGASGISNKGNPAVRNARLAQIEWEKRNNFDPDEDWDKEFSEATFKKSESSILNKIHSSRSKLNKYNSESLTIDILNKYKKQYRNLSHVKINDSTDGRIYTDNGKVVAMVNTQKKADGSIWIQGLEVFGEYRGQELSYGLLDIAVRELRSNYLSVRKTNSKAIKLYNNYGFITYKQDNYMQYMHYR